MKVYEVLFRDGDNVEESSFTIFVHSAYPIEAPGAVYCNEVSPDWSPTPDIIIRQQAK